MKNLIRAGIVTAMSVAPFAALAAIQPNPTIERIGGFINQATPVVVALALLGFFWGLALYIFGVGKDDTRKKGLSIMIWGIIALFVMLSVFGIINALQGTFGVSNQGANVGVPCINPQGGAGPCN